MRRASPIPSTDRLKPSDIKAKARRLLRWAWVLLLYSTGTLRWARRRLAARGSVVVLTFHRVLKDHQYTRTKSPAGMLVREESFEQLVRYVSKHYHVVRLADGPLAPEEEPRKLRVAFTFDDAWADNVSVAAPIARKYGVPLTVFLCSDRLGLRFPFWPERVAALYAAAEDSGCADRLDERLTVGVGATVSSPEPNGDGKPSLERKTEYLQTLPPATREQLIRGPWKEFGAHPAVVESEAMDATMTWDDVHELAGGGVVFGSHTQSHPVLTCISSSEAQRELGESKKAIEERLGQECTLFSYPHGDSSLEVRALVARAGYRFAFLNSAGAWTCGSDPLLIPRINVWEGMLVGPAGRFSRVAFEYAAVWRAYRASRRT